MKKTIIAAILLSLTAAYYLYEKIIEKPSIYYCYETFPYKYTSQKYVKGSTYLPKAPDIYQNIKRFVVTIDYGLDVLKEQALSSKFNQKDFSSCHNKQNEKELCEKIEAKYSQPFFPEDNLKFNIENGINHVFGQCTNNATIIFHDKENTTQQLSEHDLLIEVKFSNLLQEDNFLSITHSRINKHNPSNKDTKQITHNLKSIGMHSVKGDHGKTIGSIIFKSKYEARKELPH